MHPIQKFLEDLDEIDKTDFFVTFLEGKVDTKSVDGRRLLYYARAYAEDPSIFKAPDDIKLEEKNRLWELAQEYQNRQRRLAIIKGSSKHLGQPMLF